jgi:trimethylamine---corrinoid protein Co-methyltransferase
MMIPVLRPKLELLGPEFVAKIVEEAFGVLEAVGVFVENPEALELLGGAGAGIEPAVQRARLPRKLVAACLDTAPAVFKMYDRSGLNEYIVGGDEIHFDPGSAAVSVLDANARVERAPVTADLVRFYALVETLENIDFQSTGIVSGDVPHPIADAYRLYLGLLHSAKPFVTGLFRTESFGPMRDMLAAVRGGPAELARKPLAIFDACPSPPLKWSRLTTQSLIDCARAGIPNELISMGLTGATSLVTLAGTLVQHVAENLCGLAIGQLASPGSPVVFGGSPASFDMRKGTTPMGAMETMMIDAAYAQIAKNLKLPSHAYMALSDSKIVDVQAGLETGMGAVLAALAGINVISGPGMLDFESSQSLEKLVVDDEICGMARRLVRGIEQRDEVLALDKLRELAPDAGFLSLPHTRRWYRKEHILSRLADRDTYEAWVAQGRTSMAERASGEVERRLEGSGRPTIEPATAAALRSIMRDYAGSCGVRDLPAGIP